LDETLSEAESKSESLQSESSESEDKKDDEDSEESDWSSSSTEEGSDIELEGADAWKKFLIK
jgi:hypothetical protein